MAKEKTDKIIEALLFVSDKPLSAQVIASAAGTTPAQAEKEIDYINNRLSQEGSPVLIRKIAGGYEFLTKKEFSPYIKKLYKNRFMTRLSRPALEVLSIIAYKQPITKQEVEAIRGVNSDGVYHTLLERKLIKIAGRKDSPGRPLLYATSREFLQYLGINSLEDLPKIDEIKSILEKDEFVEKWDERVETAKGQSRFEFESEEGMSVEEKLKQEKPEFDRDEDKHKESNADDNEGENGSEGKSEGGSENKREGEGESESESESEDGNGNGNGNKDDTQQEESTTKTEKEQ